MVLFQWLSPPMETRRFLPISFFRFVERRPYLRGFFITHSKEPVLCYFCLTRVQTSPPQYLSSRQGGTRTHTHEALVPKTSVSAISPLAHIAISLHSIVATRTSLLWSFWLSLSAIVLHTNKFVFLNVSLTPRILWRLSLRIAILIFFPTQPESSLPLGVIPLFS